MTVKYGNVEILKSELVGKSFDKVQKKFPNIRENMLRALFDMANPPKENRSEEQSLPPKGKKEDKVEEAQN